MAFIQKLGGLLLLTALCTLPGCASDKTAQAMSTKPANAPVEVQLSTPKVNYRAPQAIPAEARNAVLLAYEARQSRQWEMLPGYAQLAHEDVELGAYPMYWYLRQQLSDSRLAIPSEAIQQFMLDYQGQYLAQRLADDWRIAAAKIGDFSTVASLGSSQTNNTAAACAYQQSLAVTAPTLVSRQVLETFRPNNSCWDMLRTFVSRGLLNYAQLQASFKAAVEYDNKFVANQYASIILNANDYAAYQSFMANPQIWLDSQTGGAISAQQSELRALAFSRLARADRDIGMAYLQSRGTELLLPPDLQWTYTQFALMAILNLENRADAWYRQGKQVPLSDYNSAWRVRAALRQPQIDWSWVKQSIELMNANQRAETAWVYWHARALLALGQRESAQQEFLSIQSNPDFYGQLAQEQLQGKIHLPAQAAPVTAQELAQIKNNTGLQRAIAANRLGWRSEAVAEWNYAILGLNDRDLIAAAAWAEQEHFYDRVINTSQLTKTELNFKQRYMAPFGGQIGQQARNVGVDPAWVYGLIRQESRFVQAARSSVGASGLMQLMPGTARILANALGLNDFSHSQVNDFETNTLLGTSFLKQLLGQMSGSEVLATAGYNAGPNRAIRWRDSLSQAMEGAIFAETIPFTETRLYVKHVMANTTWYQALFSGGQPQSLIKRLGTISPW